MTSFLRHCATAVMLAVATLNAQVPLETEPPSRPADVPPPPRMPLPPLPAPRQFPLDQLQRAPAPAPNPGGVTATAEFDPANVRLMRFGEYRVTVHGARTGIQMPDRLPTPNGLVCEFAQRSLSITAVNGLQVESTTYHYSATAGRPGTFVMPSFNITVAGAPVTVPAAQVQILEPGANDLPYQSVSAVIDLPPGDYYVGQTLPARLLVFDTPDETVQAIINVAKPSGDFLFQNLQSSRRDRIEWEGKQVNALVNPLKLTPIKPGTTEITIETIVYVSRVGGQGRPMGNVAQAMLQTPPVRVRVRALPEKGRKPGFTGGIGKFELGRPNLSASNVVVGDPVTLTVTLTGDGNLEAIAPPPVEPSDVWQIFTPTGDVTRDAVTGRGTKTITYTLVPRSADTRATPAIPFSVFDPERGEYVDLSIPPVAVTVTPGAAAAPTAAASTAPEAAANQAPASTSPEPILTGLAETTGTVRYGLQPLTSNRMFWLLQMIPAGALLGLWYWRRRADYLAAHPEVVRRRAARKASRRHLAIARSAAEKRQSQEFVRASIDAIRAAAAPLDTTEAESLVLTEVLASLPDKGSEADRVVRRLFERAHSTDFSGHQVAADGVFELLPEVERTVATIEKHQP